MILTGTLLSIKVGHDQKPQDHWTIGLSGADGEPSERPQRIFDTASELFYSRESARSA